MSHAGSCQGFKICSWPGLGIQNERPREELSADDRDAIDRSVTKMLKEGKVPDFREGYHEWRKACGGVYTITVAEAVAVGEETFRKNLGCGPA